MAFQSGFMCACLVCLFASGAAISQQAFSVTCPSAHDTAFCGEEIRIKWKSEKPKTDNVVIDLFIEGKQILSLGEIPDKGKMKWTVPSNCTPSNTCRIRISRSTQKDMFAFSDTFAIQKPSLTITEPNSQSSWEISSGSNYHSITWKKKGVQGPLKIDLLRQNQPVYAIASGNFFNAGCSVTFPEDISFMSSSEYRIKITSMKDSTVVGFSDEFTINNPNSPTTLTRINIGWMPRGFDSLGIDLTRISGMVFKIGLFSDERKDTTVIGVNRENNTPKFVTTKESVSQWYRNHLGKVLHSYQIRLDSLNYDVMLSGAIREFNVLETSTYKAVMAIKFQAFSKSGERIWEQEIKGQSHNWGKSYNAENYYECISDCLVETARELLENEAFQNALNQAARK